MKINSELPLELLEDYNNELNQFDFVLYHLYKEFPLYMRYFMLQVINEPKRLMILDNSAYEFYVKGQELDLDDYAKTIKELEPDYYILPDVLMDKNKTLEKTQEFLDKHYIDMSYPMAVLQGMSSDELLECADKYDELGILNICIPFHNSFFKECEQLPGYDKIAKAFCTKYKVKEPTQDMKYAIGRVLWMQENGPKLQSRFNHIHLLGSHCPYEKKYYKNYDSMDTGYPVKCGIEGFKLYKEPHKPDIILDEFFDKKLSDKQLNLIKSNVKQFKLL